MCVDRDACVSADEYFHHSCVLTDRLFVIGQLKQQHACTT
jgi:hypothetical protein